jgi:type VI secretion system protein ImpH
MRTSQRPDYTSVIDRLLETPWRFDLVQALRLIEQWQRRNGVAPAGGTLSHVRFRNSLSMNFPASQPDRSVDCHGPGANYLAP